MVLRKMNQERQMQGENLAVDDRSALSKLCDATELLEMILAHLSASELYSAVTATGTDHPFYGCVIGSIQLQQNMLLRASDHPRETWYAVHRRLMLKNDEETIAFELPSKASLKPSEIPVPLKIDGATLMACYSVTPVRLCPLLEVRDSVHKTTVARATYEPGRANECLNIVGLPEKSIEGDQLLLTNPPTNQAEVYLQYTAKEAPLYISITRQITSTSPLTLAKLLETGYKEKCEVTLIGLPGVRYDAGTYHISPHLMIQEFEVWTGTHFELDLDKSRIWLMDTVVPSEEEWEEMRYKRAKEKVTKSGKQEGR